MSQEPIILFCYPASPWSAKVEFYLALRKIAYAACHQPMTWPRPDIQELSTNYRRIPLLTIGRDIYCDIALILEKLESLFPTGALGASDGREQAIESLLDQWSQTALMKTGPALLPASVPLLSDQTFLDDRKALWGNGFDPDVISKYRPGLMVEVELNEELIEKLLSDGRKRLQNSEEPTLADIHGRYVALPDGRVKADSTGIVAFFFQWATALSATFLEDREINTKYPRAYDFLQRYHAQATAFQTSSPDRALIQGSEAISQIRSAAFAEDANVVAKDPTQLAFGRKVAVSRTDDISGHSDAGVLVALSSRESVIEVSVHDKPPLHIHCPRRNFLVNVG